MENLTLEQEFEKYKALHKWSVLYSVMKKFYADLNNTGVTIPEFMQAKTPDELALADMQALLSLPDGGKTFNQAYNDAWEVVKEYEI